jgi:hypothetical protein
MAAALSAVALLGAAAPLPAPRPDMGEAAAP